MESDPLAQFANQRHICLETFRKNGQGVATPVWFIEDGGFIYVRTGAETGKYKRVRNNPKVRLVPGTARGKPTGTWVDGEARILDPTEVAWLQQRMDKKYGLMKRMSDTFQRLKGGVDYVGFAIKVGPQAPTP